MSNERRINLGRVEVGDNLPCLLIAEIGLNHNGSVTLAHNLIEAAARSGASVVKFQKRSPADLATAHFLDAPFPKCPLLGKTQREVRNRLEFSFEQLKELRDHALELGLLFSMSVFDGPSLQVALALKLEMIKIASHSITNLPFLRAVAETRYPTILSMGAATWEERDRAYEILMENPLAIMHCVSAYPCPEALVKLDTIQELRRRYSRVIGYSGHEAGMDISVAAAVLGAALIERHFTINRSMVGLDHLISLEPQEFAEMARRIRYVEKSRGVITGIAAEELAARTNYHVAVCARRPIRMGQIIQAEDLSCKQPLRDQQQFFLGYEVDSVVGKRALRNLEADQAIAREAVEQ